MSEKITVPKGTLIHIEGMPFWMAFDTEVDGLQSNYELGMRMKSESKSGPASGDVKEVGHDPDSGRLRSRAVDLLR